MESVASLVSWAYYGSSIEPDNDPPAEIGTWTQAEMRQALASGNVTTLEKKAVKGRLFDRLSTVGAKCCKSNTAGAVEGGAVLFLGALLQAHVGNSDACLLALRLLHCLSHSLSGDQLVVLSAPLRDALVTSYAIPGAVSAEQKPAHINDADHKKKREAALLSPYYAASLLLKIACVSSLDPHTSNLVAEAIARRFEAPEAHDDGEGERIARHELTLLSREMSCICEAIQRMGARAPHELPDDESGYDAAEEARICLFLRVVAVIGPRVHPRDVPVVLCTLFDVLQDQCSLEQVRVRPSRDDQVEELQAPLTATRPFPISAKALSARAIGLGWRDRSLPSTDSHTKIMGSCLDVDTLTLSSHAGLIVEIFHAVGFVFDTACHVTTMAPLVHRVIRVATVALRSTSRLQDADSCGLAACVASEATKTLVRWLELLPRVRCLTSIPQVRALTDVQAAEPEAEIDDGTAECDDVGYIGEDEENAEGNDNEERSELQQGEQQEPRVDPQEAALAWQGVITDVLWQLLADAVRCSGAVERNLAQEGADVKVEIAMLPRWKGSCPFTVSPSADSIATASSAGKSSDKDGGKAAPTHMSAHQLWFELLHELTRVVSSTIIIPKLSKRTPEQVAEHTERVSEWTKDTLQLLGATRHVSHVSFLLFTLLQNSVELKKSTEPESDESEQLQFDYRSPVVAVMERCKALASLCAATGKILQQQQSGYIASYFSSSNGGAAQNPNQPSSLLNRLTVDAVNNTLMKTLVFLSAMRATHMAPELTADEAVARLRRWQLTARELVHTGFHLLQQYGPAYDEACADVLQQLCDPVVREANEEFEIHDETDDDDENEDGNGQPTGSPAGSAPSPSEGEGDSDASGVGSTGAMEDISAASVVIRRVPRERPKTDAQLREEQMMIAVAPPESFLLDQLYTVAAACQRHKGWIYNGDVVKKLVGLFDAPSEGGLRPRRSSLSGSQRSAMLDAIPRSVVKVLLDRFDVQMALRSKADREWAFETIRALQLGLKLGRAASRQILQHLLPPIPTILDGDAFLSMVNGNR